MTHPTDIASRALTRRALVLCATQWYVVERKIGEKPTFDVVTVGGQKLVWSTDDQSEADELCAALNEVMADFRKAEDIRCQSVVLIAMDKWSDELMR